MSLKITPSELLFKFELRKPIPATLTLRNTGNEPVAFKVKTTSPKSYAVRPNTGIVPPGSITEVQIIMQAQKEVPDYGNVRDKFLVQSRAMKSGEQLTPEVFSKTYTQDRELVETRLRVVYLPPQAPPSPVPEETSESQFTPRPAGGTTDHNASDDSKTTTAQYAASRQVEVDKQYDKVRQERDDAIAKVKGLEAELASVKSNQTMMSNKAGVAGFSLIHLLLTSIICFLLGRYT